MALPSDFANLRGWWKADSESYADGAAANIWSDRSGLGINLTGVAATFRTGIAPGGLPALAFDGVDDVLGNAAPSLISVSAFTFYAILRFRSITKNSATWYENEVAFILANATPPNAGITANAVSGIIKIALTVTRGGSPYSAFKPAVAGVWYRVCGLFGSNTVWFWLDNFSTAAGYSNAVGGNIDSAAGTAQVGGRSPYFASLDIAEAFAYNVAHDETTRTTLQQYLETKYGSNALAEAARNNASRRLRLLSRPIPIIRALRARDHRALLAALRRAA